MDTENRRRNASFRRNEFCRIQTNIVPVQIRIDLDWGISFLKSGTALVCNDIRSDKKS